MIKNFQQSIQTHQKAHTVCMHEKLLSHQLNEALDRLNECRSMRQFLKHPLYQGLKDKIQSVIDGIEYGIYNDNKSFKSKESYRAVFWNLAGQLSYESLSQLMKTHPVISRADFYCFAHSEIGMAKSHNRNIVRSLALEKSYNYVSTCSYLHLNRAEQSTAKLNQLGIEGVSILTPYPLSSFRLIPMANTYDSIKGLNKKIGYEKALIADLNLGHKKIILVVAQLDVFSSPKDRVSQLNTILSQLTDEEKGRPILFAGDLQTTTYNTKSNFRFMLNLLNKLFRGFEYIAKEHHLHPELYFEKDVFSTLLKQGFHFDDLNEMGKLSSQKPILDFLKKTKWSNRLYGPMLKVITSLFFSHHDLMSSRTDWFAGNNKIHVASEPHAEKPRVIENYSLEHSEVMTHTPLVLDFSMEAQS